MAGMRGNLILISDWARIGPNFVKNSRKADMRLLGNLILSFVPDLAIELVCPAG